MSAQLHFCYFAPHQQIAGTPSGFSRLELLDSGDTSDSVELGDMERKVNVGEEGVSVIEIEESYRAPAVVGKRNTEFAVG